MSKLIDARSDQSTMLEMKDNSDRDRIPSPPPIVRVRAHDIFSLEHFDIESSESTLPGLMVDVPLGQGKSHLHVPRLVPPFLILSVSGKSFDYPPTLSNLTDISSDQYCSMGGHSVDEQGLETTVDMRERELKQTFSIELLSNKRESEASYC